MLGRRTGTSHYMKLQWIYKNKIRPFAEVDILTEYEQRHWLSPIRR